MSFLANDLRLFDPGVFFLSRGESCGPILESAPKEFRGELLVALPGVNTDGMAAMMDCMATAPQICRGRPDAERMENGMDKYKTGILD